MQLRIYHTRPKTVPSLALRQRQLFGGLIDSKEVDHAQRPFGTGQFTNNNIIPASLFGRQATTFFEVQTVAQCQWRSRC